MTAPATPELLIGLDVGSTTVKAVVVDAASDEMLWSDYQRHETKQPEKLLEFLQRLERDLGGPPERYRAFITGTGGSGLARFIGAKFVQEVNAVSLAVEKLYPQAGSVIELGGQDAKIIIFKEEPESSKKKKFPSMNDKCAGGTGAVIDKINAKLKIPPEKLCEQGYLGLKLHPVAGKCGVFAETDINGLQKQGVPQDELMASLFEAIVQQNLSVLTRGHTLRPHVLLLGGPNTYIRGMVEAWKVAIPKIWAERNFPLPPGVEPQDLIRVPQHAQYFAALGAVEFGRAEEAEAGRYCGTAQLSSYITKGRHANKRLQGGRGLCSSPEEFAAFKEAFRRLPFTPARFQPGEVVEAFVGIDGGSTSTKAVLLSRSKEVLAKAYQLSKGNPIEDTIEMFARLRTHVEDQAATLRVLGVGVTGYAKDILKDVISADVALVETVAHTQAALRYYKDVDVICDVGGQDIKIIMLKNGQVKDFKLNTQCSAGNGYFLQSTAEGFGYQVEEYADIAFQATAFPEFGYGCAVFMQSDIVDFQRQGWSPEEIMAGLAKVLPKNIWLYVCQIPNLAKLGRNFVLQGGTQHNLAAVKSQVDFIRSRFRGSEPPNIRVHRHTGESGAIGVALEAARLFENGRRTAFIGLDEVARIQYTAQREESTRCYFCKNKCLRTFIDVQTVALGATSPAAAGGAAASAPAQASVAKANGHVRGASASDVPPAASPQAAAARNGQARNGAAPRGRAADPSPTIELPLTEASPPPPGPNPGARRLIIATCEKGTVEDVNDMRRIKKGIDAIKRENPNFAEIAAQEVWKSFTPAQVADVEPRLALRKKTRERLAAMRRRAGLLIGIPRVLNMYSTMPFFSAYFESLGVPHKNLVFSDFTTDRLYREGAKRGAIDPCFPSKVAIPHIHNLITEHHRKKKLHLIFFPMIADLPTFLVGVQGSNACPTVTATPAAVKAAFIKEGDVFAAHGITFLTTLLNLHEPALCARQLLQEFGPRLGLSQEENRRAVQEGYAALERFSNGTLRRQARQTLDRLVAEDRLGLVVLARPYHNDPGLNHEILEEFQKLGYPVFTIDSLPLDADLLEQLFGAEIAAGEIPHALSIADVWKNSYSENTSRKLWAAKFTARHPNLVALELSNFKCGHDAPIYAAIEEIIERSGTPYFSFKDIDENKPAGSIKIRIETISYFLQRYREDLRREKAKRAEIEARLRAYEAELRGRPDHVPAAESLRQDEACLAAAG